MGHLCPAQWLPWRCSVSWLAHPAPPPAAQDRLGPPAPGTPAAWRVVEKGVVKGVVSWAQSPGGPHPGGCSHSHGRADAWPQGGPCRSSSACCRRSGPATPALGSCLPPQLAPGSLAKGAPGDGGSTAGHRGTPPGESGEHGGPQGSTRRWQGASGDGGEHQGMAGAWRATGEHQGMQRAWWVAWYRCPPYLGGGSGSSTPAGTHSEDLRVPG